MEIRSVQARLFCSCIADEQIGSMDASEASTFNKAVDWYKGRGHWFSPPQVQLIDGVPSISTTTPDIWPDLPPSLAESSKTTSDGWVSFFSSLAAIYDVPARKQSPLADYYRSHIRTTLKRLVNEEGSRFGALVIEPVCLGAGGMIFVDPLFQSCMVEVVRSSGDLFAGSKWSGETYEDELGKVSTRAAGEWRGLPVIYDEGKCFCWKALILLNPAVFSGLHRFGYHSAASVLTQTPDIAAYAKILTGGLLPLSATVASHSIFQAFLSDKKVDALLHGHSYTANPVGCSVSLKAIEMVEKHENGNGWRVEKDLWGLKAGEKEEIGGRGSFWSPDFLEAVSKVDGVKGAMAMGTVLAVELGGGESGA